MTNSGFSDYQKLDLSQDLIPIQRDNYFENSANKDSNDKVRQISAQDFYSDILSYVEGNAKADLKIMNVQEDISFATLELLADNKTFKLTSPKGYIDDTVILTSPELLSIQLETQKDYNEFSYEEIVELKRLLEFYTERSFFIDGNGNTINLSQIEDAVHLLTINLKNQIAISPGYSPAITVDDGSYILNEINLVVSKLQQVRDDLRSVYEATLVSKYVSIVVGTSDTSTIPQPGEMVIMGGNITNNELEPINVTSVRVSKFAYARDVEDITGYTPDNVINYLPFDKEGSIFRIKDSDYLVKYDANTPAITQTDDYFDIELDLYQVSLTKLTNSTPDTIVGMMVVKTDNFDLNATGYMTVDGLDPLNQTSDGKRRFIDMIHSHGGFTFSKDYNDALITDVTGVINFHDVDGVIKKGNLDTVVFGTNETTINRKVELTGELNFENGSEIVTRNARCLTDRGGLKISVDADYPLALVSTSGYKEILSVWTYDTDDADDGRAKSLKVSANGNVYSEGTITANTKLVSTYLDSGEDSNLNIQHDGNTRVYVGDEFVTINAQGKLNKEGTEDDHLITKKYVDDAVQSFSGNCLTINEGKLCAGTPKPRWYTMSNWSDEQLSRLSKPNSTSTTIIFWSSTYKNWIRVDLSGSSSQQNSLSVNQAPDLDSNFTRIRNKNFSAPRDTNVAISTTFKVSGDYMYFNQQAYSSSSSAKKANRYVYAWNMKSGSLTTLASNYSTTTGAYEGFVDYLGNFYGYKEYKEWDAYAGFKYAYALFAHNPTNDKKTNNTASWGKGQGPVPFLVPNKDNNMIGSYMHSNGSAGHNFRPGNEIYYMHYDTENNSFSYHSVTSKLPVAQSNFNATRYTSYYINTSRGPITKNILWVHDAPELEEDEGYLFGIFHTGDYPTQDDPDTGVYHDVYRVKLKTDFESLKNINWISVFNTENGAEKVYTGDGVADLRYFSGEIIVVGYTWAMKTYGGTPGEVVNSYKAKNAGSIDFGQSFDVDDETYTRDIGHLDGYNEHKSDQELFGKYGTDKSSTYVYLHERKQIKPGTVFNVDGGIDPSDFKDSFSDKDGNKYIGVYKYDFAGPRDEPQPLLWNGENLLKTSSFLGYPELPSS